MRLLPSERKARMESAIKEFEQTGQLVIYEPCNCGSQIRHNNGGNYHTEIELIRDSGRVFAKYGTTCELVPPAEWKETDDWQKIIRDNADWL